MWHFCVWSISAAEMSKTLRHWCQSVSDFYGGTEMSNGHFGTSAEMSRVRSVLGPKCPYTLPATWRWPTYNFRPDDPKWTLAYGWRRIDSTINIFLCISIIISILLEARSASSQLHSPHFTHVRKPPTPQQLPVFKVIQFNLQCFQQQHQKTLQDYWDLAFREAT